MLIDEKAIIQLRKNLPDNAINKIAKNVNVTPATVRNTLELRQKHPNLVVLRGVIEFYKEYLKEIQNTSNEIKELVA